MAVQCFVNYYSDKQIDRQVTPRVIRLTANYTVYDPDINDGEVGDVQVSFLLTDDPATQAVKIRNAVRDHIRDVITRPDLVPANRPSGVADVRIPNLS